jgi:glutathione S-transferase
MAERAIPYAKMDLDFLAGEFKSDWFLKINPRGMVPALTDGDVKLFESGAILLYIADKYDPTINTSEERAIAAQWVLFANSAMVRPRLQHMALLSPSHLPKGCACSYSFEAR